jgi:hypothetical protein
MANGQNIAPSPVNGWEHFGEGGKRENPVKISKRGRESTDSK